MTKLREWASDLAKLQGKAETYAFGGYFFFIGVSPFFEFILKR